MKRVSLVIIGLTLVVILSGCAVLPMESKLDKPVAMSKMSNRSSGQFVSESKAFWLFWGLMPLIVPEVDSVVAPELINHAGVQNLKIVKKLNVLDVIISGLTSGFLYVETVTISGEVYD